jgi:Uma2 family endonuclease
VASTPTRLMTFAEYEQVPNQPGGRYELRHGELAAVTYPFHPHVRAQRQLRRLLENAAGESGVVHTEMPFRPLPEHECWAADVAYVAKARWDAIDRYLFGAPELVIEVLSPSNTKAEMQERERICVENGSVEFWAVDTERCEVRVATRGGQATYKAGQRIPLFFGGTIAVDEIFR